MPFSQVHQLPWMSLPEASGLGNLTRCHCTRYLDVEVSQLTQRFQGLQSCHLGGNILFSEQNLPFHLFELVVVDGEELEVRAVLQHLQPLAEPVFADVQFGEAWQFREEFDICEARVFKIQFLQFDKVISQTLQKFHIHKV